MSFVRFLSKDNKPWLYENGCLYALTHISNTMTRRTGFIECFFHIIHNYYNNKTCLVIGMFYIMARWLSRFQGKWWLPTKRVIVMCRDAEDHVKNEFISFVTQDLHRNIKWMNGTTHERNDGKYLLLTNITSRIPDDVEYAYNTLVKELKLQNNDILVVAMHRIERSKIDIDRYFIKTLNNAKHPLKITNILYWRNSLHNCLENKTAKREIEEFLAE